LNETENEIGKIEDRLKIIETEMSDDKAQSDHILLTALLEEQENLKIRLHELYEIWTDLTEQ